ncbi:3240_t:CDS:1, partial [Funneliformis geosporum]
SQWIPIDHYLLRSIDQRSIHVYCAIWIQWITNGSDPLDHIAIEVQWI